MPRFSGLDVCAHESHVPALRLRVRLGWVKPLGCHG